MLKTVFVCTGCSTIMTMKYYVISATLLAGLFGILQAAPLHHSDIAKCPKKNGRFPKPGSLCKSFYECRNFKPTERQCPPGEKFHEIKRICDYEEDVLCLEKPGSKECPTPNGRFLKKGTQCKEYFDCCNGKPTEKKCPRDSLFDPTEARCEHPHLFTCGEDYSTEVMPTSNPSTTETTTSEKTSSSVSESGEPSKITPSTEMSTLAITHESSSRKTETALTSTTESSSLVYEATTEDTEPTGNTITENGKEVTTEDTQPSGNTITENGKFEKNVTDPQEEIRSTNFEISTPQTPTGFTFDVNNYSNGSPESSSPTASSSNSIENTVISTHHLIGQTEKHTAPTKHLSSTVTSTILLLSSSTITDISTEGNVISTTKASEFDITQSVLDNFLCPEPNGYFPHPTNKHQFIGCVNNHPSILTCPSNLEYVHRKRRCDYQR